METGFKAGTERSAVVTEAWVPVVQDKNSVIYGDVRYMGDDNENREGNIGVGYRQVYGAVVVGGHAWFDRRETERGATFHQMALGAEILGRDVDARVNTYIPLSEPKRWVSPNIGSTAPRLVGSGIFVDTNGVYTEAPQGGFDVELGWRVPAFEEAVDSIRIYGGGYAFTGDETPSVAGVRTRVSVDVNRWFRVGASFQRDAERGSQGVLEATLRFPFSAKKSFREEGIRARLDESPERDIDIVTSGAITDTGLNKSVINAESGDAQRVLYVDNTAAMGGDGTKEKPFNTLRLHRRHYAIMMLFMWAPETG